MLARLQTFDPPGIGARDLRECLLLQLRRDEHRGSRQKQLEYEIIDKLFDEFTHKRWDRIAARLHLTEAECERLQRDLKKLNPRPGSAMGEVVGHNYQQIVPDFAVETDDDGGLPFRSIKATYRSCVSALRSWKSFTRWIPGVPR